VLLLLLLCCHLLLLVVRLTHTLLTGGRPLHLRLKQSALTASISNRKHKEQQA
jgi:hypothetical protein